MIILGVLNVTPDSFSDGELFFDPERALQRFEQLLGDGADYVDVGAESTAPGAKAVSEEEEFRRLFKLLSALEKRGFAPKISLDSYKDSIALQALGMGVRLFNNVYGLYEPDTLKKLAAENSQYICMHSYGRAESMQKNPLQKNMVVNAVEKFFAEAQVTLEKQGFAKDHLWFDPGIGFGKDDGANFALLRHTKTFGEMYNVCVGLSRKGFLGRLFHLNNPCDRDDVTKAFELSQWWAGARMIRTHAPKVLKIVREFA